MMNNPSFTLADLDARLRFRSLWKMGIEGEGITAAVIDTGINHIPDLEKSIVVDKDFTGENNPIGLQNSHATAIAKGIHIMAPKAAIANLKVLSEQKDPDRDTVCQAIQFCIEQYPQYKIINLSLYFLPEGCCEIKRCVLCSKVNEAAKKGIVVVAAAGNLGPKPGTITCPGLADCAIPVVSTWTKEEAKWWEDTSNIKKWWVQATGEFGKSFGTSYSAAWVSGGIALLLSSFKEAYPREIKQAIFNSAFKLRNSPETSGLMQCDEAFNLLINPQRYETAKRALYALMGNELAQKNESSNAKWALGLILSFIEYRLLMEKKYQETLAELKEVPRYIIPGVFPLYEQKIKQLLELCN